MHQSSGQAKEVAEALSKRLIGLKEGSVGRLVYKRLREFSALGKKPDSEIYKELCFCTLTANYSAEGSIRIVSEIGDQFLTLPLKSLSRRLKSLGYRFPNKRAEYIFAHRKYSSTIGAIIHGFGNDAERRDWLVGNIKGIGYKEASHFLRNIGYRDYAIIDYHIIDILEEHGLIGRPRSLTRKKYLEIEQVLRALGSGVGMDLAELDLFLWYLETGKVLK